ncbi:hypothetical protein TCAL_12832 [Tigriopus californicus]|uniref:Potassium channel domain-containing protein n=1 Tax=Tigriopus californicus TaxID=6832 RepID=A0A553NXU0_TIGCA|nr:potassium channel subfamily K member 18-like [Tigriopus californicus]TRY70238.1 hypothetical protein TCAL_12832 [Tigriopus californicus]
MHTTYHKISARERDTAPRYYYKRTRTYTFIERVINWVRKVLAFLFTQVGVCGLIALYMVMGAFVFASLEADSQMEESVVALKLRKGFARSLWNATLHTNVLRQDDWQKFTRKLVVEFQHDMVVNIRHGYTGTNPGVRIWTFSSALMYSLTIFTTIGYGNLTPKTDMGKLTTIFYALIGIPLMLLYMTNIGHILGSSFKYTYTKLCRCSEPEKSLPTKATLPSALATDYSGPSSISRSGSRIPSRDGSTSKKSSNESESKFSNPFKNRRKRKMSRDSSARNSQRASRKGRPSLVVSQVGDIDLEKEFPDVNQDGVPPANDLIIHPEPSNGLQVPRPTKGSLKSALSPLLKRKRPVSTSQMENGDDSNPEEIQMAPPKTVTVEFKLVEDIRLVTIPVTSCLFVLMFYIILGTVIFSNWEGWDYLDGAYFCFTSLMTIGFGDFVPGNDYIYQVDESEDKTEARAKLIIGTVYILLGMALLAMCLNLMQEKIVQQVRDVARKVGLIRPTRFEG